MKVQKVIKIGNSFGFILPIDFIRSTKLKIGDEIEMEVSKISKSILIVPKKLRSKIMRKFEFYNWLNEYTEKNKELIRELAKY